MRCLFKESSRQNEGSGGKNAYRRMSFLIDPVTRQRVVFSRRTGDLNYDLQGDDAIAKEDVPVIGPWTDWTGSADPSSRAQQQFASSENQLQGTDAQVVGNAKLPNLSVIGTRVGTNRRRIIKRNVQFNNEGKPVDFSARST